MGVHSSELQPQQSASSPETEEGKNAAAEAFVRSWAAFSCAKLL